nr:energy transducer TonB [Luteimonas galliterrae]
MPKVPREVSRARGHGMVLLVVTVDSNGLPKKILIGQSSGDDLLDGAAAEAAKRWRYYPWVTKNGIKFSGLVRIPVNFTLDRKFMIEFRH